MNQKSGPGAGESLLTWSSKQTEGRPSAFWSVRRTFEKGGMGTRDLFSRKNKIEWYKT